MAEDKPTDREVPAPETVEPTVIPNAVERAENAAERIEKGNAEFTKLVARQEKATAQAMLGGRTHGSGQVAKPKEETPQEYAKKVLANEV